jgi:hypothetical protein
MKQRKPTSPFESNNIFESKVAVVDMKSYGKKKNWPGKRERQTLKT